ncbi:NAD(P)-dependent oxidoreductase [Rhizorhapis suberifaciens]|uniref:NAD(P)-binding domain-containing protein n=1 Tax=Rhizorhapis suberifaciens TaxID=13656 RepID=A0A840HVF1_9SPHN|nr:NAD(P)-dependent oxidoreductase [Rhizorhapis suberifaciens]MBB4641456.1 hypothetical protein [Rhizorhapis suberifaciens]
MKAALLGATGPVGKRLLQEMLDRGHAVTAIVRNPGNVPPHPNVTAQAGDIDKPDELVPLLRGHDAVIVSIRFLKMDASKILGAVRRAGVPRYLMVGGAASLYLPGTRTKVIDSGQIPAEFMAEPTAGIAFFSELKQADDLDWTFLSPPMMFSNDELYGTEPGGRTGVFRTGLDELITRPDGSSAISYEDYAVAMVDELENPVHSRRRFTVGY